MKTRKPRISLFLFLFLAVSMTTSIAGAALGVRDDANNIELKLK